MNTLVSFELSKLLKEKEFNEPVNNYFQYNGKDECFDEYKTNYNSYLIVGLCHSRPTIVDVVMWLYVKHNIWIRVSIQEWFKDNVDRNFNWYITSGKYTQMDIGFHSPTEAYESAIEYTLKNLI